MLDNKFHIEVPIIGEQQISLYDESRQIYKLFKDEILRLKDIMQLGALHYFSEKLFKYTRYDHILTMLLLINRLETQEKFKKEKKKETNEAEEKDKVNKLLKYGLTTSVTLNGIRFSSLSELLKSWTLLYAIGHFQMTFAAEHAFLRWIKSKNSRQSKFLKLIREQIEKSKLFKKESTKVKNELYKLLATIIIQERIMQVHKVFTFLKILKNAEKLQDDDELIPKLRELTKLMMFRKRYLNYEEPERQKDLEHSEKVENVVDYFLVLRELSFTVLDGYVAQSPIQLNYHAILNLLPLFLENKHYKEVVDNIEKFYTRTLYQSVEGAYYHLRAVSILESQVFGKYDSVEDLLEDILSNKIDEKIKHVINKEIWNMLSEKHQGKIHNDLKDVIEINFRDLKITSFKPITCELNFLTKMPGIILYNMASKEYQMFIYPNLAQYPNKIARILAVLNTSTILYYPLDSINKRSRIVEKNVKLNSIVTKRFLSMWLVDSLKTALNGSFNIIYYILRVLFEEYEVNIKEVPIEEEYLNTFSFPFVIKSDYLSFASSILKDNLSNTVKEKGKYAEPMYAIELLEYYGKMKKLDWYLVALDTKLMKNNQPEVELDILIIGFSPEQIMLSISEVKSGKHKNFHKQLRKLKRILEDLKPEFEKCGYKVEISPPKNLLKDKNVKTLVLSAYLDLTNKACDDSCGYFQK